MVELPSAHELSGRLYDGRPAAGQVHLMLTFMPDAAAGDLCSPPTKTPRCGYILPSEESPVGGGL